MPCSMLRDHKGRFGERSCSHVFTIRRSGPHGLESYFSLRQHALDRCTPLMRGRRHQLLRVVHRQMRGEQTNRGQMEPPVGQSGK